jgi:hypothetical protein
MSYELNSSRAKLPSGGLRALLKELGSPDEYGNPPLPITGEIKIFGKQRDGSVYLKNGKVYAAQLENFTPPIALRLMSSGVLTQEMFAELNSLAPNEVSKAAIAKHLIDKDTVEDVHRQMLFSTLTHMYEWRDAEWVWIKGNRTKDYTITPLETRLTISATDERLAQWFALVHNHNSVTQGSAIVYPAEGWGDKVGQEATPEINSILQYVNGINSVAQIASACGFARFEIASRLAKAIADGIVTVVGQKVAKESSGSIESLLNDKMEELTEAREMVAKLRESLADAEERLRLAEEAIAQ